MKCLTTLSCYLAVLMTLNNKGTKISQPKLVTNSAGVITHKLQFTVRWLSLFLSKYRSFTNVVIT